MNKRIGVVVGGGDCPGLNAVIRIVGKTAAQEGWETLGIIDGYGRLLPPGNYRPLDCHAERHIKNGDFPARKICIN